MKALGMPPSDPRARQMNDAQWLFCYFNQMEDEKEEADSWKARFDYLTWFINFDMAKRVSEQTSLNEKASGNQGPRYVKQDLHNNTSFEREALAAAKGYDPSSGLTVDEFFEQLNADKSKEPDIINDSFEDLLASGEFNEVVDVTQGVGNPNESADDFITRALMLEAQLIENDQSQHPIGIEEEHLRINNSSSFNAPTSEENQYTIDDSDLDIFEVDE